MTIIGIDPGKSGAIAVLRNGKLFKVQDCPLIKIKDSKSEFDRYEMLMILRNETCDEWNVIAIIEQQHAFAQQGGVGNFSAGLGYGLWLMAIEATGIKAKLVTSQAWRKAIFTEKQKEYCNAGETLSERKRRRKSLSISEARERCPEAHKMLERKKDDGRAEAILIALSGLVE